MGKPTPPEGHRLIEQRLKPGGVGVTMEPPIPVDLLSSIQVWNPWQDRWEKPKYLVNNVSAWLAVKDPK